MGLAQSLEDLRATNESNIKPTRIKIFRLEVLITWDEQTFDQKTLIVAAESKTDINAIIAKYRMGIYDKPSIYVVHTKEIQFPRNEEVWLSGSNIIVEAKD